MDLCIRQNIMAKINHIVLYVKTYFHTTHSHVYQQAVVGKLSMCTNAPDPIFKKTGSNLENKHRSSLNNAGFEFVNTDFVI